MRARGASPFWLIAIGAVLAIIGLFMGLNHASFAFTAEHARGEVVDVKTQSHRSGRRGRRHSTFVDVRFNDARGVSHTFHSQVEDNFGGWKLHEQVDVLYPGGLPEMARVGGFANQWGTPLAFFLGGLVSFGVGWFRRQP